MTNETVFARYSPKCAHCKTNPAALRISGPPSTDQDGNEVKSGFKFDPIDMCLDCLGSEVERLKKIPPLPPVGQRAWAYPR